MTQILFIHGGDSYQNYEAYISDLTSRPIDYERLKHHKRWRTWIAEQLPNDDVLLPTFPNGSNAQYNEWCIYFEKLIPFLSEDTILVGHSLGAMFLAKYLHENTLPFKTRKIVLISGQHGKDDPEKLAGSFMVESSVGIERSTHEVHLFHSEDDPVVPYVSLELFAQDIPSAVVHSYKDMRHFNSPTFPDLLELLQQK